MRMTTTAEPRRRLVLGGLALLLVVGAGMVGWKVWGDQARDPIWVTTRYDCPRTGLSTWRDGPAINSRPGWRCTAHVRVENRGSRDARVVRIVGAMVGSRMGSEAVALPGGVADPTGEVEASWAVDEVVRHGRSKVFDVRLGWRQDGCNSAGHFWVDNWPTVTVHRLGRTVDVPSLDPLQLRTYDDAVGHGRMC
jgi:hypothetical protein